MEDKATFADSTLSPTGIKYVIINGETALKDGKVINSKLGKTVKYPKL